MPCNFWRSLETPSVNWKIELKVKRTKYCILVAPDTDKFNIIECNDNVFTIKDTQLYVPVVNLSARDNQKPSKLLSNRSERSVYWSEQKTKSENKNTANEYQFLNQILLGSIYCLF